MQIMQDNIKTTYDSQNQYSHVKYNMWQVYVSNVSKVIELWQNKKKHQHLVKGLIYAPMNYTSEWS